MITPDQCSEIEQLAEGLTENEVCLYIYGYEYKDLPGDFKRQFDRAYCRGRTKMKLFAIQALKDQMRGKNGLDASLAVLTRFADAFPKVTEMANSEGSGFNFRVELK